VDQAPEGHPGHTVVVVPSDKDEAPVREEGPDVAPAGMENSRRISLHDCWIERTFQLAAVFIDQRMWYQSRCRAEDHTGVAKGDSSG